MPGAVPDRFGLIIGGMKCGTTTLFEVLSQHPQIAPCREKEPDFFADDDRYSRGLDHYRSMWDWDPGRHHTALEASTAYSKHPWFSGVPERIAASLPVESVRFIYMIRHPVRRIASQVRHSLYEGWGRSLDDGLDDDAIDFSRYAAQLDRYLEFFSPNQIFVLAVEDYRRSPVEQLSRVCEFLGVRRDHDFSKPGRVTNSGDFFQVSPGVAAVARTGAARRILGMLPHRLRRGLRGAIAAVTARLTTADGSDTGRLENGRWKLSSRESEEILHTLREDLVRLRDEWGVDVEGAWGIRLESDESAAAP